MSAQRRLDTIRIYHECEGRIEREKNPSCEPPVIPRDGFFDPTRIIDNFLLTTNKLSEVPEYA